jgi:ppGpp synthetase/RelA/SpoT-type nucleotidyltranferase
VNLDEYEHGYLTTYEAFAAKVRFILEAALQAAGDVPTPQSIQCRAKGIDSLRRRLTEAGQLETRTLELERRDLAGVRLIFYTNSDVDRFLASPLIRDNFDIDEDSTKIHHPTLENKGARYRAIHYTIRLREDRVRLPEYAGFAGLRCEIQVQTILNHAWSETSHNILYKDTLGDGYGENAMKGIARRFERIMDRYLIPAGFEFQKAQQDYERVLRGKELFDKDIVNLLRNARNNNERYEILSGLRDSAIPNYDDLPTAYLVLKRSLLNAVQASRVTEPTPIETTFGNIEGFTADAVTRLVVEIVESLRYADVVGTLQLLIDIHRDETSDDIRKQIVNVVEHLTEYNISAYRQVGLGLQMALLDHIAGMSNADVDSAMPIALCVWKEALESHITGAKWKADSVTLSTGAVPASEQLREVRDKAIRALFAAYDRSEDDSRRRAVLSALDAATRTPTQTLYSNALLAATLIDATRILEFVTQRAKLTSYELLQHLEHRFLYDYFRAKGLADDPDHRFGCRAEADALVAAICEFRDTINVDDRYARYKVLVGFESVYPDHWTDQNFDYNGADEYRGLEADRYIEEIDAASENEWFALITRCAETKSQDLATFPVFAKFLSGLAERKPEIAGRCLARATDDLRNFLPCFLNGLSASGTSDIYERTLKSELESARSLAGVARHIRFLERNRADDAGHLLRRAIGKGDSIAVIECLLFAVEQYGTDKISDADAFVRDALTYLNDRKDPRWAFQAWFLQKAARFYEDLTPERTSQVLQNLGYVRKVDYQVERVLLRLAERQPEAVWDFFGARLAREAAEGEDEARFEAVPFRFFGLEKELSKHPQLAIGKGLSWFSRDRKLFQFRGGRVLSSAFPDCTPEFSAALVALIETGGESEADFALAILQNYRGETSTHAVLKELVSRYPDDAKKMSQVRISIDSTGVVSGEFGFAEALRSKRESVREWLADGRTAVKEFAEKHIAELGTMIAAEQRRAEAETEMRKRGFQDESGDESDDTGAGHETED